MLLLIPLQNSLDAKKNLQLIVAGILAQMAGNTFKGAVITLDLEILSLEVYKKPKTNARNWMLI